MKDKYYICIDLKSFYASVECIERGLDPLDTNLVVADNSRTAKTICLAVTPSLKSYGLSGRSRLFEVIKKVREINDSRLKKLPSRIFVGESCIDSEIKSNPELELSYIIAPPRMAYYMEYSTRIYEIYLKYIAHEDIHVYSIDEVFIDVTSYLNIYKMTAYELAAAIIRDIYDSTGITATAGVGTNMYLAKIAMDIIAKKSIPDETGARIGELNEMSYRRLLWSHKPITDFWRVGNGIAKKLETAGIYTMGDIAKCSVGAVDDYYNEELLYKLFGVNAELLIDHAWGWEPTTIEHIRSYKPMSKSISSGQVLSCPYDFDKAKLVVREMTELMCLDLVDKGYVTKQLVLTIGYDISNLADSKLKAYTDEITNDFYGRKVPKHAHGTANLDSHTASSRLITAAVMKLYDKIVNRKLLVRRMTLAAANLLRENELPDTTHYLQLDFFSELPGQKDRAADEDKKLKKEKAIQRTMIDIKKRYGKNAILKGMNFEDGATAISRNSKIGGHKA